MLRKKKYNFRNVEIKMKNKLTKMQMQKKSQYVYFGLNRGTLVKQNV